MLKVGDRVYYWYRMNRVGTIVGTRRSDRKTWLQGATPANAIDIVVRFDDGTEEAYPSGELRLVE